MENGINSEELINDAERGNEFKLEGNDWVLPSDTAILSVVWQELEKRLKEAGLNDEDAYKILTAADEALTNAIMHGNLEVPGLKDLGNDKVKYKKLKAEALKTELAKRKVYINVEINSIEVKINIKDEGKGIPVGRIPNPMLKENQLDEGGKGVFLMRQFCDSVEFSGTQVTLRKKIKPIA